MKMCLAPKGVPANSVKKGCESRETTGKESKLAGLKRKRKQVNPIKHLHSSANSSQPNSYYVPVGHNPIPFGFIIPKKKARK